MIEQLSTNSPKVLGFKLSGKLHNDDYQHFVPVIEEALALSGKIRLLAEFDDFHGWDAHAAWDDFKLGVEHYSDFERIAMVGDKDWERWMAIIGKPFTGAQVKYFDKEHADEAWAWLDEPA